MTNQSSIDKNFYNFCSACRSLSQRRSAIGRLLFFSRVVSSWVFRWCRGFFSALCSFLLWYGLACTIANRARLTKSYKPNQNPGVNLVWTKNDRTRTPIRNVGENSSQLRNLVERRINNRSIADSATVAWHKNAACFIALWCYYLALSHNIVGSVLA